MAGRGTPAIQALTRAKIPFTVHEYAHDPAHPSYGVEAAEALGVVPDRVFKTLVTEVDGALAVGVVPVTGSLNLKALAAAVGGKRAAMADPAAAERATGYVRGGISPLGQRRRLRTVIDESALAHPTVYVSAGRRGLEIELAPADLVALTSAAVAALSSATPAPGS
ncbi:MAG: Cys-tRNA(Pro) deacylase [Mycobacteriales bacterium]